VDDEGNTQEKVVRVAGEPGMPNRPQKGVDPDTCARNTAGSPMLCGVWRDPDFDPDQRAFYYARVLEEPVCRYSTLWCQSVFGLNPLRPKQCNDRLEELRTSSVARDRLLFEYGAACCSNQTTATIVQPAIQERAWSSPIWYTPAS
jgi:hypothetical protein